MPSPASTAHAASGTNKDHMERRAQYDQHRRVHGTLLMQLRKVCDCRSEAWHVASHKRLSLRRHLWPCKASKTVRTRVNEQSCLRRESRRCIWRKHGIGVRRGGGRSVVLVAHGSHLRSVHGSTTSQLLRATKDVTTSLQRSRRVIATSAARMQDAAAVLGATSGVAHACMLHVY